ncbi:MULTISPECIES: Phenylacetic acid catabolic protein [unclassified Paenibacillus]|uniref:Phenylacetic acid catabolic protein n=1 Tax=unclassified Paenibacillus TaxID=185978 RepID=UPI001AE2A973|nr:MULTISPECIES: Phenylacetic acid catabolic protein [unclassified Paenibacillus]MBP1156986.1 1,2-phenylacetyl-CoA epoxidase catalytic subunit [Paenibacillus sp. PvP091]MBP1172275.1 1,2-phenylacetyl-CoA epoxidase catalytic subunit [Paenibacillus sp. PvR098]MBP2438656.1 1,2-phenylacetyl-CoA epoxidase catalytic subunit [Paenibacillus sp. PvP052]
MGDKTVGLTLFIETIETIADNKYVLGDLLVEIGVSGPDLEATLSMIAMAQGELGHARLLYNWAFDLKGTKKQEIERQTGKAFASVVAVNSWIDLIGSLYVVNVGLELALKAMLDGRHADVVNRINKLLKEQKEHIIYSRGWVEQLLNDQGAVPRKIDESIKKVTTEVRSWLKSLEDSAALVEEGYLKAGVNLTDPFQSKLASLQIQRAESDAV